jgi:signal transduction histidine kinase
MDTYFDSSERLPFEEILKEIIKFKNNSLINQLLEGYPELAIILNQHRQIVAFNSKALNIFNTDNYLDIVGKRTGEAFKCIHSAEMEGGCGTSQFCKECGAGKSIKKTIDLGVTADDECRLISNRNGKDESFDFAVRTQPIRINDNIYTMFAIRDISNEKRREALEKIFFHDVLNTAGAVRGLAEILPESRNEEEKQELTKALISSSNQLVEEIISQRKLRNAEDGNLEVDFQTESVNNIIASIYDAYKNHKLINNKKLIVQYLNPDVEILTDHNLLVRSLGNLVKNALEASENNQEVLIFSTVEKNNVSISVGNQTIITGNIQLQLFQRSFSTKEKKGRGIGLYSVKLIVEQYLKGTVHFISDDKSGTIFTIRLPKNNI